MFFHIERKIFTHRARERESEREEEESAEQGSKDLRDLPFKKMKRCVSEKQVNSITASEACVTVCIGRALLSKDRPAAF